MDERMRIRRGKQESADSMERAAERGTAKWKTALYSLWQDEDGIGVIEIVLILVVLIGLVLIFKDQINALLGSIFDQIEALSESVY